MAISHRTETRRGGRRITALIAMAVLSATATLARAQVADSTAVPSAEGGRQVALRLCAGCHLVEPAAAAAVPAGVPSLRAIANRPGQTGERVSGILMQPHAPMPDIRLSLTEIRDLLAYLEGLRTAPGSKPLIDMAPRKAGPGVNERG